MHSLSLGLNFALCLVLMGCLMQTSHAEKSEQEPTGNFITNQISNIKDFFGVQNHAVRHVAKRRVVNRAAVKPNKNIKKKPAAVHKKAAPAKKSPTKKTPASRLRLKMRPRNRAAAAKCDDKALNCDEYISYCLEPAFSGLLKQYCFRSCGHCAPAGDLCKDADAYKTTCKKWSKKGFCDSTFFQKTTKRSMCAETCDLCSKDSTDTTTVAGGSTVTGTGSTTTFTGTTSLFTGSTTTGPSTTTVSTTTGPSTTTVSTTTVSTTTTTT